MATLATDASAAPLKRRLVAEVVLALYQRELLPVGKAMELAGMTRREFHEFVQRKGVARPFDEEELRRELSW